MDKCGWPGSSSLRRITGGVVEVAGRWIPLVYVYLAGAARAAMPEEVRNLLAVAGKQTAAG